MVLLLLGALLSPAVTPARQMQDNRQMKLAQVPTVQLTEWKHPRGLTSSFPGAAGDAELASLPSEEAWLHLSPQTTTERRGVAAAHPLRCLHQLCVKVQGKMEVEG